MSRFLQLHVLTFYPPSNLNRDDSGRPKTCSVGGYDRLRISSQCLKRSWRTSTLFGDALDSALGTRSKRVINERFQERLLAGGIGAKNALEWSLEAAAKFGSVDKKKKDKVETSQLVHFTPGEIQALEALADQLIAEQRAPTETELGELRGQGRAVDIALFGRMLADSPGHNVDAAVQVAHAFTVNQITLEEDFFTAVDDLNRNEESGAGHLDEAWFGSGLYYLYICINCAQLAENLGGDEDLARRTLRALTEAVVRVSPSGKQNSFAALAPAAYLLAERGDEAPRTLAISFMEPIRNNFLKEAVAQLESTRDKLNRAYGQGDSLTCTFAPLAERGTLKELLDFVAGASA